MNCEIVEVHNSSQVDVYVTAKGSNQSQESDITLHWNKENQRFVACASNTPWLASSSSSGGGGSSSTSPIPLSPPPQVHVLGCSGIYGVLPIGGCHSSLIYITKVEPICMNAGDDDDSKRSTTALLRLPGDHQVYRIVSMSHRLLPTKPRNPAAATAATTPSSVAAMGSTPSNPNGGVSPSALHQLHPPSTTPTPYDGCVPPKALREYMKILDRFVKCRGFDEGVHLYFSPTLPLLACEDLVHTLQRQHQTAGGQSSLTPSLPVSSSCSSSIKSHVVSRVFRWNSPLLDAFPSSCGGRSPGSSVGSHEASRTAAATSGLEALVPAVMRGYVGGGEVITSHAPSSSNASSQQRLSVVLITRLSCIRAGTRYNQRGLDHATGVPANFSETTQILFSASSKRLASYRIIRGSIPRHWQQPPDLTFKPKITISPPEAASRELRHHFQLLSDLYGKIPLLHCVDATSMSKLERPLTEAYQHAVAMLQEEMCGGDGCGHAVGDAQHEAVRWTPLDLGRLPSAVRYTKFDLSSKMKKMKKLLPLQEALLEILGKDNECLTFSQSISPAAAEGSSAEAGVVHPSHLLQESMFRVNCLDCLDRANLMQSMICLFVASRQLRFVLAKDYDDEDATSKRVQRVLRHLWVANGTALSGLYAGSSPHFVDLLLRGEVDIWSLLHSGHIALSRFIQQNFRDGRKQDAVSLITRSHITVPGSSNANPFERRISSYNFFVGLSIVLAFTALMVNTHFMVFYERYRFRSDFWWFQAIWGSLLAFILWRVKRDPYSFCNFPVLK